MGKEYLIGDFLKRIKRSVVINDNSIYKRITISTKHKGVSLRDKKIGASIGTKKQFLVKKGDFILSKIDARNGAFGVVPIDLNDAIITGNFWTYIVDTKIVDIDWFLSFTNSKKFIKMCKDSSTGTTHRKYLDEKIFLSQKIIIPNIQTQKQIVKRIRKTQSIYKILLNEIQTQKELVKQLKQSILQEAIQGKLTEDWRKQNPDVEPASELLKRIKAKKEKLIKEKKIRKEKPLPPITQDEIPFELPDGWVWCRLGEIIELIMGQSPSGHTYNKVGDGLPFFQGKKEFGEIYPLGNSTWCSEPKRISKTNDILISVRAPVGDVNISDKEYAIGRGLSIIRVFSEKYLYYWYIFYLLRAEQNNWKGKGSFFSAINRDVIENKIIPLPPLAEQKVIVEKVEKLMQNVSAMEEEIQKSEQNAEMLMQAVLKEAFEGKKEDIEI
jgi:type I restriction enzyme S subunit